MRPPRVRAVPGRAQRFARPPEAPARTCAAFLPAAPCRSGTTATRARRNATSPTIEQRRGGGRALHEEHSLTARCEDSRCSATCAPQLCHCPALHRSRCRRPLGRRDYVCANKHSFDVARSGYVNLLQPQDRSRRRRATRAEAVAARRRFLERGMPSRSSTRSSRAAAAAGDALLDVGCGEGHHLAAFRRAYGVEAHGVDISVAGHRARRAALSRLRVVVANADRFLPYADASFDAVTSITARLQRRRVCIACCAAGGTLLVVIPGADDLSSCAKPSSASAGARSRRAHRRRCSRRSSRSSGTSTSRTSHASIATRCTT